MSKILLILVSIFISIWLFNHYNAWVGIGWAFTTAYLGISHLIKQNKQ